MTEFKDRISTNPNYRKLTKVQGTSDIYEITRCPEEGVQQDKEGTELNADNLNQALKRTNTPALDSSELFTAGGAHTELNKKTDRAKFYTTSFYANTGGLIYRATGGASTVIISRMDAAGGGYIEIKSCSGNTLVHLYNDGDTAIATCFAWGILFKKFDTNGALVTVRAYETGIEIYSRVGPTYGSITILEEI